MVVTAVTEWGRRLDEILADGEWHDREDVIRLVAEAVPPGRAFRKGEAIRRHLVERQGFTFSSRSRGDDGTSVATGARHIARACPSGRERQGTIQRDGDLVRRRP